MTVTVWAFGGANDVDREKIYDSIKNDGISRFGWSSKDENDLKLKNNWSDNHSRQLFLLQIKQGDWIVHINTPEQGKCIAGIVTSEYDFDEGIKCAHGIDFRHRFSLDPDTVIEFERGDPNVLSSVNLGPRYRYHRVYAVKDFLQSIEDLKSGKYNDAKFTTQDHQIKDRTKDYFKTLTKDIHEMHKGKKLESFLARVLETIPGVDHVQKNGSGWGTDYGADLIITLHSKIGKFDFEQIVIVQVKSFEGQHYDLGAVDQIKTGIEKFNGTAGMLITTAESTPELEERISQAANEIGCPIHLLCGKDVAKFVVENAPELLFHM